MKSSSTRERCHHFSLDQLTPPVGSRLLVGSIFVERAGGGTSTSELITEIHSILGGAADLSIELDRVVAQTLGNAWRRGLQQRFDREAARASLQFFDGAIVPSIPMPLLAGVSDVRFKADLGSCQPLALPQLRALDGIFSAAEQI